MIWRGSINQSIQEVLRRIGRGQESGRCGVRVLGGVWRPVATLVEREELRSGGAGGRAAVSRERGRHVRAKRAVAHLDSTMCSSLPISPLGDGDSVPPAAETPGAATMPSSSAASREGRFLPVTGNSAGMAAVCGGSCMRQAGVCVVTGGAHALLLYDLRCLDITQMTFRSPYVCCTNSSNA
jgi:hypothetical protein